MPIAIILMIIPAALFGTVMVMMGTSIGGLPEIAVGVAVVLVVVVLLGTIRAMQLEHPSQADGDPNLPQDRSPPLDAEDADDVDDEEELDFDDMVTPTTWMDGANQRIDPAEPDLGAWSDDGAPPRGNGAPP